MQSFRVNLSQAGSGILRIGTLLLGVAALENGSLASGFLAGGAVVQAQAQAPAQTPAGQPSAQLPECQPPRAEEYLLLVPDPKPDTQAQLRQLLPANAVLTDCNYLNAAVVRVEGFASADIAAAWAQYLLDSASLQAYVSRPAAGSVAANPSGVGGTSSAASPAASPAPSSPAASPAPSSPAASPAASAAPNPAPSPATNPAANPAASPDPSPAAPRPAPNPTTSSATGSTPGAVTPSPAASSPATSPATSPTATLAYNPQPLGVGFAVVVSYFNDPEVANRVRQVTTRDVGLVSFEQEPYLLATYTTDAAVASALLKTLSERGLTAAIVDSRRAVLLSPVVRGN